MIVHCLMTNHPSYEYGGGVIVVDRWKLQKVITILFSIALVLFLQMDSILTRLHHISVTIGTLLTTYLRARKLASVET